MAPVRAGLLCAALVFVAVTAASAGFSGPNGKIVFDRDVDPTQRQVFSMNADGRDQVNLTNNAAADVRPAWSPDGKKIAFGSLGRGGGWEVFVMDADGSDQKNLSNNPAIDWEPTWSPDGTKIAFTRITQGSSNTFEVIVMNSDGSGQKSLTIAPDNG